MAKKLILDILAQDEREYLEIKAKREARQAAEEEAKRLEKEKLEKEKEKIEEHFPKPIFSPADQESQRPSITRNSSSAFPQEDSSASATDESLSPAQGGAESATSPRVGSSIPQEDENRAAASSSLLSNDESPSPQHYREIVIDKNGQPRQAGADQQYGKWIVELRSAAEKSLFLFAKGILNRHFLTENLHKPVCEFVQKVPPFRKLVLLPREHGKTAIISGALPLHIIIQPAETNIYFPGLEGSECRIMLAGENMRMAKKNLRVLESIHSENKLFRTLWPQRCWGQPTRQAKVWNQEALIFPRENEWPDPTIWALGVDGAVTGSRPNVMIKDDLISIEAANSDVVMESAIEWHIASRALLDSYEVESGLQGLEFIIGTYWAVFDLYSYIQDNDPSVEVIDEKYHKIIRDGKILWPEKHTEESIEQLRKEHGSRFYLLYLNSAADPELVDFDLNEVREFKLLGKGMEKVIYFEEDERDEYLTKRVKKRTDIPKAPQIKPGTRLNAALLRRMGERGECFRARFG